MIGTLIASIAASAAKGMSGGIADQQSAREAKTALKRRTVAGAEQKAAAGAFLGQAVRGQAVTDADIAPQVSAAREGAAKSQRGLMSALQVSGAGQQIGTNQLSAMTQQNAETQVSNLRNVYAQQAQMNLQARQQASQTIVNASAQQAQLDRQRDILRGRLSRQKWKGLASAITATEQKSQGV